jgi:hypothetical protein
VRKVTGYWLLVTGLSHNEHHDGGIDGRWDDPKPRTESSSPVDPVKCWIISCCESSRTFVLTVRALETLTGYWQEENYVEKRI